MNAERASLLFAALLLALVLGGVGLFAWSNEPRECPTPLRCSGEESRTYLNRDGAPFWWYAAGGVLVLAGAAMPLVGRRAPK